MSLYTPNSFNAYASEPCNNSLSNLQDSSYRGPVILDSYWTDRSASSTTAGNPVKKEVGPEEGPSTFAVVLVNRSPNDIINVQGALNLPSGFAPTGTSGDATKENIFKATLRTGETNPAVATYDNTVIAGSTFTLYFDINVLKQAKIGLYPTPLVIDYYTAGDFQFCNSAELTVPFMLPGKVVLDASVDNATIIPNQPNKLVISLINKGSADATGVVATIQSLGQSTGARGSSSAGGSLVLQSTTTQLVNLGSNTFNVGTIPAHGKTTISTTVYPSGGSSGTTQNVQLQLTYTNAYGYTLTSNPETGLVISPDTTTSTLNISYTEHESSPLLTAGKLEDLNFAVTNNGTNTLSNIVISLTPPSSSLSIVGDSKWTIQSLNPGDTQKLSTKVFAATSLIDTPVSFSVSANYISNGLAKTDSLNLGAYVVGDISIQVNDISISYIGNTPTLAGTLLNQGSTTGLFTSVQLLHPEFIESPAQNNTHTRNGQSLYFAQGDTAQSSQGGSGQSSQGDSASSHTTVSDTLPQYIGDLTADSPTPFSIPLSGEVKPGVHQVLFKVVYADSLKHFQELTLNGTVNVQQSSPSGNARQGSDFGQGLGIPRGMMMFIYLPITGASVAAATVFVMRKHNSSKTTKTKNLKNNKDIDIASLLDDSSSNKK